MEPEFTIDEYNSPSHRFFYYRSHHFTLIAGNDEESSSLYLVDGFKRSKTTRGYTLQEREIKDDGDDIINVVFKVPPELKGGKKFKRQKEHDNEIDILNHIRSNRDQGNGCDQIIGYYGTAPTTDGQKAIIMQYCENGSLSSLIGNSQLINGERLLIILRDVAKGIEYLHSDSISLIHRDIKPDNILIDKDYRAYIADFGISTRVDITGEASTIGIGTPVFMAPVSKSNQNVYEQSGSISYQNDVDIYSFGVLIFVVLSNVFVGVDDDVEKSIETALDWPDECKDLIKRCVCFNPQKRPKIAEVVKDLEEVIKAEHLDKALENRKVVMAKKSNRVEFLNQSAFNDPKLYAWDEKYHNIIKTFLSTKRWITISACSGTGKSVLCYQYAIMARETMGMVPVWIDCLDLKKTYKDIAADKLLIPETWWSQIEGEAVGESSSSSSSTTLEKLIRTVNMTIQNLYRSQNHLMIFDNFPNDIGQLEMLLKNLPSNATAIINSRHNISPNPNDIINIPFELSAYDIQTFFDSIFQQYYTQTKHRFFTHISVNSLEADLVKSTVLVTKRFMDYATKIFACLLLFHDNTDNNNSYNNIISKILGVQDDSRKDKNDLTPIFNTIKTDVEMKKIFTESKNGTEAFERYCKQLGNKEPFGQFVGNDILESLEKPAKQLLMAATMIDSSFIELPTLVGFQDLEETQISVAMESMDTLGPWFAQIIEQQDSVGLCIKESVVLLVLKTIDQNTKTQLIIDLTKQLTRIVNNHGSDDDNNNFKQNSRHIIKFYQTLQTNNYRISNPTIDLFNHISSQLEQSMETNQNQFKLICQYVKSQQPPAILLPPTPQVASTSGPGYYSICNIM
ncbi:hypothetical protein DFA_11135 [Cavenderia fasciculata]|uniref:Protein kinase domain-containing protein n=1 Tax=Cavenderia fasciculata TaxID=261658 RepID=F4QF15_CACFS|nr:uncharacterized protein DFA_11135 [Cavenderia fasciculata]EGG13374.1 hypothetical protein DFA_11135 [Cavenderia fasciculata]|eukprot:XP_004350078.1 hypothetical protein DFA_11135 [Cavenderia fasciculata]